MASQVQLALILVVALFASSNAAPLPTLENDIVNVLKDVHVARLDRLFDRLLPHLRNFILQNGLDPMELPDKSESLLPDAPGILKGSIDLKKGWLQEMSTIKRAKHVTATYSEKILDLEMDLGFDVLDFNYEYDLKYLLFRRQGDLNGRMFELGTKVKMTIDLSKLYLKLQSIKFTEMKNIDIRFEGNILDFILNMASKAVTFIFKNSVMSYVENHAFEIFDAKFREINNHIPRQERAKMIRELFLDNSLNSKFD